MMPHVPVVIFLLRSSTDVSDDAVARVAGCTPRTVQRYRRRMQALALCADGHAEPDAEVLDQRINGRRGRPSVHPVPDLDRVRGILAQPGGTLRAAWRDYQGSSSLSRMSFSTFRWHVRRRISSSTTTKPPTSSPAACQIDVHLVGSTCDVAGA